MAASTGSGSKPPPSPFPFAAAPDIIRAHQKDAYFSGVLTNQLTDLHRRLLGARSAHAWAGHARLAADLVYLCLTTLIGNRTLGEEYCDLLQVESDPALPLPAFLTGGAGTATTTTTATAKRGRAAPSTRLPSVARRGAYIVASILVPHFFSRLLPSIRAVLRRRLEARLRTLAARAARAATTTATATATTTPSSSLKKSSSSSSSSTPQKPMVPLEARIERYILEHLPALTSGAPWQAAALTAFYFGGAYYSLAKRAVGLRYIFTRNVDEGPGGAGAGRGGYEILGVLMVLQFAIQAYLHVRSVLSGSGDEQQQQHASSHNHHSHHTYGADVSLDHEHSFAANNDLLLFPGELPATTTTNDGARTATAIDVPRATHTPVAPRGARYDLSRDPAAVMGYIKGAQQRKCTLCLDEMRDPAATSCGHVFCWACIGDWVREKPECPLCRREALVQHILPLRAALAV